MKIKEYYDVTVIGAGPAGLCAAIQAARAGVSTCLVEKNGIAGGTITAGGIPCPGIFHAWGRQVISGIGWELVRRTREESGEPLPDFSTTNLNEHWRHQISIDPVLFAALCDEEFEKAGVIVKYHTMVGRATLADDGIELELCGKDGLYPVFSRRVIDCTGDANVARMLHAEVRVSDPCQPGTLCVYATGYDPEKLDLEAIRSAFDAAAARGEASCEDTGWSNGFNPHFLFGRGNNSNHISGINGRNSPDWKSSHSSSMPPSAGCAKPARLSGKRPSRRKSTLPENVTTTRFVTRSTRSICTTRKSGSTNGRSLPEWYPRCRAAR